MVDGRIGPGGLIQPAETTLVNVSGKTHSGREVSSDLIVQHPKGWGNIQILGNAINQFRALGGILVDTPDGGIEMFFAVQFATPLKFTIKSIITASVLP